MEILLIRHGDPDYANDTLTPRGHDEAGGLRPPGAVAQRRQQAEQHQRDDEPEHPLPVRLPRLRHQITCQHDREQDQDADRPDVDEDLDHGQEAGVEQDVQPGDADPAPRPAPVITPSCPAAVELVQLRFPSLVPYLAPFDSPWEAAAAAHDGHPLACVVSCPSQRSALLAARAVPRAFQFWLFVSAVTAVWLLVRLRQSRRMMREETADGDKP